MLKFRVVALHPMPKSRAYKLLKRSVDTGIVQEGIEIMAMDWESGEGRRWGSGEIDPNDLEEMRIFFNMIRKSDIRAAKC
jgi:hypothetical protein